MGLIEGENDDDKARCGEDDGEEEEEEREEGDDDDDDDDDEIWDTSRTRSSTLKREIANETGKCSITKGRTPQETLLIEYSTV